MTGSLQIKSDKFYAVLNFKDVNGKRVQKWVPLSRTLHPCKDDFITFGTRIGVLPKKLTSIIELFATEQPKVYELIENSFLDEKVKRMYKQSYQERLHRFQRSDK